VKTKFTLRLLILLGVFSSFGGSIFSRSFPVIDSIYCIFERDCDGDGYYSSIIIRVPIKGSTPSNKGYLELWSYDNQGDSSLLESEVFNTYYPATESFYLNNLIGHSTCKIKVKVKDYRYSDVIDSYTYADSLKYESRSDDINTSFHYQWDKSKLFDNDGDGYNSNGILDVTFYSCPEPDELVYQIFLYHCDSQSIFKYYESYVIQTYYLSESSIIHFGMNNGEIPNGKYQVRIQVKRVPTNTIFIDSLLTDTLMFETKIQDGILSDRFTVSDVSLDSITDMDGDGLMSSFRLNFKVHVDTGSYRLHAKVNFFPSNYNLTTPDFMISDSSSPYQAIYIPPYNSYYFDSLDVSIEIYLGNILVAYFYPYRDPTVDDIWLEALSKDVLPCYIKSYSLSNIIDYDGDGNPSGADLTFSFDVISEIDSAFLLLVKESSIPHTSEGTYFGTDYFKLSPKDTSYTYHINNIFTEPGSLILLCKKIGLQIEYDTIPFNEHIEILEFDNFITLDSIIQKDKKDVDRDGYSGENTVEINLRSFPVSSTVDLFINYYLNNSDSLIKSESYGPFEIDSAFKKQFSIVLDDNNPSGLYNIKLTIRNHYSLSYYSRELKISDSTILYDQLLESPMNDVLSIKRVHLEDKRDCDNDGYFSCFHICLDANSLDGSYPLTAKIFIRKDGLLIEELAVPSFIVSGDDSTYLLYKSEYCFHYEKGFYDIAVELYYQSQLFMKIEPLDNPDIGKVGIEKWYEDSPFHIKSYSLSNSIDNDNDGIPSSADLNVIFDVISETDSVYLELFYETDNIHISRFRTDCFKLSPSDTSYTYRASDIPYTSNTSLHLVPKLLDNYFPYDLYYDAVPFEINLEPLKDDNNLTLVSITQIAGTDFDRDGYFSEKIYKINFSNYPVSTSVDLEIDFLHKNSDSIIKTANYWYFLIDTSFNMFFSMDLNDGDPSGLYDIKLTARNSNPSELKISNLTILSDQLLEPVSNDIIKYKITGVSFKNAIDRDKDSFNRCSNLHFTVSVDAGIHYMLAKLYYRSSSDSFFTCFYSVPLFTLENTEEKIFCVTIDSSLVILPHDSYDFCIELFEEGNDSVLAEIGPMDDPYLNSQKFETNEEDNITGLPALKSGSIQLFPNPVSNDLYLKFDDLYNNVPYTLKVYTNQGILVKEANYNPVPGVIKLSFADLMPGVYMLQVQTEGFSNYFSIVKF
jgi:hypothetical protein